MTQRDPLIPEGTPLQPQANFQISAPKPEEPREIKDWDDFQRRMREMTRPEDKGETCFVKCRTTRGATFTARIYKPKRREWETEVAWRARPGRVSELVNYRFPGDGKSTQIDPNLAAPRDEHDEPNEIVVDHECDELGMRLDPRTGRMHPGMKDGKYTWPEEVADDIQRKTEIMKAWWHRDLAEYHGRPLPDLIRLDYQAKAQEQASELDRLRAENEALKAAAASGETPGRKPKDK